MQRIDSDLAESIAEHRHIVLFTTGRNVSSDRGQLHDMHTGLLALSVTLGVRFRRYAISSRSNSTKSELSLEPGCTTMNDVKGAARGGASQRGMEEVWKMILTSVCSRG
jgi:hypothetical protein